MNGSWARFGNAQVCWRAAQVHFDSSGFQRFNFPQPFLDASEVIIMGPQPRLYNGSPSFTAAQLDRVHRLQLDTEGGVRWRFSARDTSPGDTAVVGLLAIGYWK